MSAKQISLTLLVSLSPTTLAAWSISGTNYHPKQAESSCSPRRYFFDSIFCASSALLLPRQCNAATTVSTIDTDKEKIIKGYNRLQYLLDNWEAETTICNTGQATTFGDACERTPIKVMEYLGFKSMNDPLFKADATIFRLKGLVPLNREEDFYDAIDLYSQNAEEANSMAFVSSWGEANPGGGKDRVQLFIERAKKNVTVSRDSLKIVMDILEINP